MVFSVDRPAIALAVEHVSTFKEKAERTLELVKDLKGPGIIYFSSKKLAENMASFLKENGVKRVMAYHGGLDTESRILIQQQFIHGQLDIVCATSAFGMGINKDNVRYVLHFHMPMQPESYLQEIGRAARDGNPALALLLYSPGDEQLAYQLAENEWPNEYQIDRLFAFLTENKLSYQTARRHEEKIVVFCGFTEIQWRIVDDYLAGLGICNHKLDKRNLLSLAEARLKIKKAKIEQMLAWIHSSSCKRAMIIKPFDEQLISRVVNCCSNCGINFNSYRKEEPVEESIMISDWKQDLDRKSVV